MPHKDEYKPCQEPNSDKPITKLSCPLSLLVAIQAEKLFTECLWRSFELSSHFASALRVLCLRGFTDLSADSAMRLFKGCPVMTHLDLSYTLG